MSEVVKFNQVESKVIALRNQNVILDSDVAELYGVETRDVNKAVKNNPDKFPEGYIFELDNAETEVVVENFHHLKNLKFSPVQPKVFTEKGLYMLATILKSPKATQTTLAIVETFTKIRELARTVTEISETDEEAKQKTLMQKSGEIIADILGDDLQVTDTETSFEINFALMKFKHTVRQKKK
ncbi:MAG: ORF6N domain-containing protein [Prevotellaceae bacterium]|jgi:phage regulator Rha-like protein|nr:ORF6N domain-containing protein [Prevotellaceae bacterium]